MIIENKASEIILIKLGFEVIIKKDLWNVLIPSWRHDIDGEADLVEEIIRVNGYSSIPTIMLPRKNYIAKPAMHLKHRQSFFASRVLANRGYNEIITFSFLNSNMVNLMGVTHLLN